MRGDGFDASVPNETRVRNFLLGGKDNFAADRELAARLKDIDPAAPRRAKENRAFILAAAIRAARAGISQFIDLGTGLPYRPAVHDAVREIIPDARVCYVESDPMALVHARALLADGEEVAASGADPADPGQVLADPDVLSVIDPAEPVAVLARVTLHFLPADACRRMTGGYISRIASGSWLAATTSCFQDSGLLERVQRAFTPAEIHPDTPGVFASYFTGLELVPPGVTDARRWTAGLTEKPCRQPACVLAAAGIKP